MTKLLVDTPKQIEALPPSQELLDQALSDSSRGQNPTLSSEAVQLLSKMKERPELVQSVIENAKRPGQPPLH
jgi:hypothetical protein